MGVKIVVWSWVSVVAGMICPRIRPMGLVAVVMLTYHRLFMKFIRSVAATGNIWMENWFGLKTAPFMVPSCRATNSVPVVPAAPVNNWNGVGCPAAGNHEWGGFQ